MPESHQLINPKTGKPWEMNSLLERVIALQEELLQSQEKNLVLSAQTRELERRARDADDIRTELSAQGVLLADKSRENKTLHQELSKIAGALDIKLNEVEELRTAFADLQQQVKMRESERDLLAVMLNEAENAAQRRSDDTTGPRDASAPGWMRPFKNKK